MTLNWRELTSKRRVQRPAVRGALPRLCVQQALDAQVLVVVAPAGYGKTTALAATLPEHETAWLTLDVDDTDPQVFMAGLALATEHLKGGKEIGALLDRGASMQRVAARVAEVLHENQTWLILDEAQHLTAPLLAPILREVLDCGQGHVALLSRLPLLLADLTPLEAAGAVTHLSSSQLSFSPDELQVLFAAHGLTPSQAELRLTHSLTEGWPIAARLFAQAAAQGRVQLADLSDLDGGQAQLATLFAYLAQEVLGPLPALWRELLTRSSVFEDLSPALLTEVLNEPDAEAILESLTGSSAFLTRTGVGSYRAHPLMRAHLRGQMSAADAKDISLRGAAYFERNGLFRRALEASLVAGDTQRAIKLLETHGQGWLKSGRLSLIERSLKRLPTEQMTRELQALNGDRLRLASRYDEALAAYAQAGELARALGQIQVALDTVQPNMAWDALTAAEALSSPEQQDQLRRWRAENLLNAGRLAEATALEPSLALGIRYALRSGQIGRALELAIAAAAGEMGGARAAQNHREALLLVSFLYAILGNSAEAARAAHEGLAEGQRLESPFVESLALARLGHALQTQGDLAGAQAAYEQALARAQGVSQRLQVEPLMGLTLLAAARGEISHAKSLYDRALLHSGGDGYMAGLVHLSLSVGLMRVGQGEADLVRTTQQALTLCGDQLGLAALNLARFAAGDQQVSEAELLFSLEQYPFLLSDRTLFSPFPERAQRGLLLAQLADKFPQMRGEWLPLARNLGYSAVPTVQEAPGFELHANILGRVAVYRAGERPRDWGRARARDLLALLIIHPQGIQRQSAQEALFPDAEPGIGERNFRVTLHALSQVLEEGAASGTFLERGEWLRLRPSPDLVVDYWQVLEVLALPVGTPGRLEALTKWPTALADSDLPEVQQAAEHYAAALPEALASEAEAALSLGRLAQALAAAEACLNLDPAHEPATRTLMRLHVQRGHPASAHRAFAALETALEGLGLSPLRETRALDEILRL